MNETDPRKLESYLERAEHYDGGLEPEVEQLVDALQEWPHEAHLQPRAGFVNELSEQLEQEPRGTERAVGSSFWLWRLLIGTVGLAAATIFIWFIAGLFSQPPLTTNTTAGAVPLPVSLPSAMKGYELYSWQQEDGNWRYTLVTATNRRKTAAELMAEDRATGEDGWVKITVSSSEALVDLLGRLPAGESVFWMDVSGMDGAPFELLDSDVVAVVAQRAGELGLRLTVPSVADLTGTKPVEEESGPVAANEEEDALLRDAGRYAEEYNVSLEEAMHRLRLQGLIGELGSTLSTSEHRTFAGLWIENEPTYQVVVAFTGEDGDEILRPYIAGQPYEEYVTVRQHRYSLAELRDAQQEALEIVTQLGIPASSDVDVVHNRVTLLAGNPALLREEIQNAGLALPEPVEVVAIDPDNLSTANVGGVERYSGASGQVIYFPKQAPALVYPEGEFEGTVVLDEHGCLRLENEWPEAPLILWQHDQSMRLVDGEVEILDGNQQVVAWVGAPSRGAGGFVTNVHNIPDMPLDACPGPYWLLGAIEPHSPTGNSGSSARPDITLTLQDVSHTQDETTVSLQIEIAGDHASNVISASLARPTLVDEQGNQYEWRAGSGSGQATLSGHISQTSDTFQPGALRAETLTLQTGLDLTAKATSPVTLDLRGRQPGDRWSLDERVEIFGLRVPIVETALVADPGTPPGSLSLQLMAPCVSEGGMQLFYLELMAVGAERQRDGQGGEPCGDGQERMVSTLVVEALPDGSAPGELESVVLQLAGRLHLPGPWELSWEVDE